MSWPPHLRLAAGVLLAYFAVYAETPNESARALLEAAQSSFAAGDFDRSYSRASEAAPLFRSLKDVAGEVSALDTAASAQLRRGQYGGALDLFRAALVLDRRRQDGKGEATHLSSIGDALFFQGKYLDAMESYEAALRRVEASAWEPWAAERRRISLSNLAILHEQLGEDARARDCFQEALDVPGISPGERGRVLSRLGALYQRTGDGGKALEAYAAAREMFAREHRLDDEVHALQDSGIVLTLDLGEGARGGRSFTDALKLAEGGGDRRGIARARLFRGESLLRAANLADARRDFEAALAGSREVGDTEAQWIALHGIARVARRQGDGTIALERLREGIGIIESARAAGTPRKSDFLAGKREIYDAAIGILLESPQRDTAQLFRWFEQAHAPAGSSAPASLAAVQGRLAAGSALVEYWIGDGRLAALWITRGGSGVIDRPWSGEDDAAVRSSLLRGIPWEGVRRVTIVPDDALHLLPFETLPMNASGQLLIERMPVTYLPSASMLFRELQPVSALAPWRRRMAVFGEPELRAIARSLPGRAAVYAGREDLKRQFLSDALAGVPVLHVAAPVMVDAGDSNRSRMRFTREGGSKGSQYLFRAEAMGLAMEGTELVVLPGSGSEAGGFGRAFLAAGAGATVTALWRVDDGTANAFMQRFYANLGEGQGKADALRNAKLSFLRQGAAPQSWAGFVLSGDGDTPLRPVLSWLRVMLIFGGVGGLFGWYVRRRLRG